MSLFNSACVRDFAPSSALLMTLVVVSGGVACPQPAPLPAKSPAAAERAPVEQAAPTEDAKLSPSETSGGGQIRSVYAETIDANPIAEKLCVGFQEIHRKRKAQCCESRAGFFLTSECTRVFSGALASKALVASSSDVDACVQAIEDQHQGCGWVGAWSQELPAACSGILKGTLDDGATCRSSLECKSGLSCHGVSPTDLGVCGDPGAAGAMCDRGIDPAATYVSADLMSDHPQCEGFCANQRCHALAKVGDRCVSDAHCGEGNHCDRDGEATEGAVESKRTMKSCRTGERPASEDSVSTSDSPPAELAKRCASR